MDVDQSVEEAIQQELNTIFISSLDAEELESYEEDEEEIIFEDETERVPDELPLSVVSCLELAKNRIHMAEQLILQDLEDSQFNGLYDVAPYNDSDYLVELASEYNEDPVKFKERIIGEIEDEEALQSSCNPDNHMGIEEHFMEQTAENIATEYSETEKKCMQDLLDWEEKTKELEEKRILELKTKKEQQVKEQREDEVKRRQRQKELEEELKRLEEENLQQQAELEVKAKKEKQALQLELNLQEELIRNLQKQMEVEKQDFEQRQSIERRRLEELRCRAATQIQARIRSFLVRKKTLSLLRQRKEEKKREKDLQLKLEKEQKEREEKRKRTLEEQKLKVEEEMKRKEELENKERKEQERRRAEYEKKKEEERLRLERKRQLKFEEEKKQEEEATKQREELQRRARLVEEERQKEEQKKKQLEELKKGDLEKERIEELQRKKQEEKIEEQEELDLKEKNEKEKEQVCIVEKNTSDATQFYKQNSLIQKVCPSTGQTERVSKVLEKEANLIGSEESANCNDNKAAVKPEAYNQEKNEIFSNRNTTQFQNSETTLDGTKEIRNQLTPNSSISLIKTPGSLEGCDLYYNSASADKFSCVSQMSLPDCIEQKRLAWMKACTPWSKLAIENKRKKMVKRKLTQRASSEQLPALSAELVLQSAICNSLKQVTTVTLEDLPGCNLSTLSECTKLQTLTLRRCGLTALDGINRCKELKHIDVQENAIQFINCQDLEDLCVLLLNRNQLTSIHGLDGATNLRVLELSHNSITRIGGLESLKKLQRLVMDHNHLISTKGLIETPTLLYLNCAYNHLTCVEGTENCVLLQTLNLQGNNLSEPPELVNHVLIKELYLDDNSISSLESLSSNWLPLLHLLSVAQNSMTHLTPLSDFISLEKLNVSHNCISELTSFIPCVEGCKYLKALSITGNPFQHEAEWRSSLLEVLPGLKKLNGKCIISTGPSLPDRSNRPPPGSFLALCQAQLKQLKLLLQRHDSELGSLSPLEVTAIRSRQCDELIKLAEEHRYAHEYGDLSVNDGDEPETLSSLLMQRASDRHQQNIPFISRAKENNQDPVNISKRWITPGQVQPTVNSSFVGQDLGNEESKVPRMKAECFAITDGESKESVLGGRKGIMYTVAPHLRKEAEHPNASLVRKHLHRDQKKDLQNLAATVIQSHWRGYLIRRDIHLHTGRHAAAMVIQAAWKGYCMWKKKWQKQDTSCMKHVIAGKHHVNVGEKAATIIQAVWKGHVLRKKLASALAAARISELHDDFEEVNVEDFIFDEAALEKDWITLDSTRFPSKILPLSNQLHWPKPPNHQPLQRQPQQAWSSTDEEPGSYHERNDFNTQCSNSRPQNRPQSTTPKTSHIQKRKKEDKILEEWGFTDSNTAQQMLKRAQKMKSTNEKQKKLLDPAVRLALFKNNGNKCSPVKPPKNAQPTKPEYFRAHEEEFARQDTAPAKKIERSREITYQWLHTQFGDHEITSSRNMKRQAL
ncbi:leucine-rich repeat and IQ domain-containing protein 1 isoform X2 [Polyodon spathula]|uniref:leucine-rich repeat and IQ domain-containing protein 1 isoform X2 n=1 Tax=Polyodon spathula TaxID=7913 RepID=UPI001B7F0D0E|nr:leucine-rich repeat and IQ domain-containing protein 1 isoform X2 [Polyodon spathula]